MLVDHMSSGFSFASFGAIVDVNIDTLFHWTVLHPAFSEHKKIAELKSLLFWEKLKLKSCVDKTMNPTPIIYSMRCRFAKYGFNVGVNSGEDVGDDFDFK